LTFAGSYLARNDIAVEVVRAGAGPVLVGLGENEVDTSGTICSEGARLRHGSTEATVLVQALVGASLNHSLEVGLVQNLESELAIRVGATVELEVGLTVSGDVGATVDRGLTVTEDGLLVERARICGGVIVG
jgi:hypothetical protein